MTPVPEKGRIEITRSAAISIAIRNTAPAGELVFLSDGGAHISIHPALDDHSLMLLVKRRVCSKKGVHKIMQNELRLSRQQAVVGYELLRGIPKAELARRLDVTIHTVRRHTEAIYDRLNVASLRELEDLAAQTVARALSNS